MNVDCLDIDRKLHETIAALSVNIRSGGNGTPRGLFHPTEDAAIDSRDAGLVREYESTYRLLLLFMSSGVKEKLGTFQSHFLWPHTELPVYCDAVWGVMYSTFASKRLGWIKLKSRMKLSFALCRMSLLHINLL